MVTGNQASAAVGKLEVLTGADIAQIDAQALIAARQVGIANALKGKLGRDPTAGEVDATIQTLNHQATRAARIKAFRCVVNQTPDPFDAEALRISHNGGASEQVIHLLPEEKQLVIAALQASLKK